MNDNQNNLSLIFDNYSGLEEAVVQTPVLDFFHSLSNIQLGGGLIGTALMLTVIVPYSIRYLLKLQPSEDLAKGTEEAFKAIMSLAFLLLAFSLVRLQGDHRGVDDLVAREATVMIKMDRAARTYGGEGGNNVRAALILYANQMLNVEWPLLAEGGRDQQTSDLLGRLSIQTKLLDPTTPAEQIARTEILASYTQLSDLREARLAATRIKLPNYMWHAIFTCFCVLVVLSWFLAPMKKVIPYIGGVACALMLLLTVLIATAGIFKSENAVSPAALQSALQQIIESYKSTQIK